VTAEEIGKCDGAFIDGDHSPIAVANDTKLARECVKRGIIVWHDYCEDSPVKPLLDILAYSGLPIKRVTDTWLCYEVVGAKS